jgi:ADP-ribosylation factor-like protein 13B
MTTIDNIPTTYGVKTVRGLRSAKLNELNAPKVDLNRQHKIAKTYDYFAREVDPIIGDCVTYLLCEQPESVSICMLDYLINKSTSDSNPPLVKKVVETRTAKTSKSQKIFLVTKVSPIISRLVGKITRTRPANLVKFMCEELKVIIEEEKKIIVESAQPKSNVSTNKDTQPPKEPTKNAMKNIQIVVVGSSSVGKSSLINILQGQYTAKVKPTMGFRPVTMTLGESLKIKLYDLGGGPKIRGIWGEYYHDVHGTIYVIDSTLSGSDLNDSVKLFKETVISPLLYGKPIMVLANKQDMENAKSSEELMEIYDINGIPNCGMVDITCNVMSADGDSASVNVDSRIESSIELLIGQIEGLYDELNFRVLNDTKAKEEADLRLRLEKERKVLKNKIACAFPFDVNKDAVTISLPDKPEDIFSIEEGLQFLASEIGLSTGDELPTIAKDIAAYVGYQKLALQMIGAFYAPISKKKVPMEWQELLDLVTALRQELGLQNNC